MGFFDKFKKKTKYFSSKEEISQDLTEDEASHLRENTKEETEGANLSSEQDEGNKKSFFDKVKDKTSKAFKFKRLKDGLEKTKSSFSKNILSLLGSGRKIDDDLLTEIEDVLITSDIGVVTSELIIERLKDRIKSEGHENADDVYKILKEEIHRILIQSPAAKQDAQYSINKKNSPHVIMMIGVNGAGKTTTIGKLAYNYKEFGHSVIIGAADTFRAAANEQLKIWADRVGVDIVSLEIGSDPGAVVFDTIKKAKSEQKDVVLIDTAGRLHNKANLMAELEKLTRITKKLKSTGPDEVFLVLDATTGQNAIQQAREFSRVAPITGIVLTKLDGTAKGGVVIAIANELKIPVRYIGVGEQMYDLQAFDSTFFAEALFGSDSGEETELE